MKPAKVTLLDVNRKKSVLTNSYTDIFGYLLHGVLIINSVGLIDYVNPAYENMFGVTNFALKGKSIYQVPNDEVVLKSHKNRKKISGYVKLPSSDKTLKATSTLITQGNNFGGIVVLYEEVEQFNFTNTQGFKNPPKEIGDLPKAFNRIVGRSESIKGVLSTANKAAKTNTTVLITGETGSGKGVIAEAIHNSSNRCHKPFVKVNCGAIPCNLLESELFGYEQGAFTGAVKRKIGKFEQANGGTIFLDEIGDMPIDMQVKVLRVIQDKEFERIGGNDSILSDVRIIAATHRDLTDSIEKGAFREDLYYRLNVIPIHVPSLRERQEDIIDLTYHYMRKIQDENGIPAKALDSDVEKAFSCYHWPGNIRELKNLLERIMILVDGDVVRLSDIPSEVSNIYKYTSNSTTDNYLINFTMDGDIATLDEYEKEIIEKALKMYGSFNKAAKALGVTHKTVAAKARKYNIIE